MESDQSSGIIYEGKSLESGKRYYWQVQVGSDHDQVVKSDVHYWEMGLLHATYFKAEECSYANGSQTALSCALYFGIVEDENTACVAQTLAEQIRANDTRLDVGLLGFTSWGYPTR